MDKETLQKKIENGDTVWGVDYINTVLMLDLRNYEPKIMPDDRMFRLLDKDGVEQFYPLKWLFDTKEDAEFELEFGNITYTKKLELPTWKQMQENIDWSIDCANRKWYLLKSRGNSIIRIEDWNRNGIYEEPLTYENYLEACRICKKLFLGEEL